MAIYDINCFYGHWPFRYLRHESLPELIRTHHNAGIAGGALGFLDSIFYNDPSEGDDKMMRIIPGSQYIPTPSINPKLPMVINDIERYAPKAVRVYPYMHGYKLTDECFAPIAEYLSAHGIRLLVNTRLYVSREAYFFLAPDPDMDDEAEFAKRYPDLKIAFLGHDRPELTHKKFSDTVRNSGNIVCDTSFVRMAPMDVIADSIGIENIVFGSSHPLLCLESTRLTLEKAGFGDDGTAAVFGGNYLRFMGL